jgi:transcription elongation factor GreA-like protein
MEPGAYVVHRSWGFGQIKSYDDASQRLLIDFKDKKSHPMDPAFCITTMDVFPPSTSSCARRPSPRKSPN